MQVYNFTGIYYRYIHDDITAFEYFFKSLELAEALGSVAHNQIRAMKEKLESFEVQQKLNRLQKLSYMDSFTAVTWS